MKFEYNSNLIYDERVRLVTEEILNEYPLINYGEAYVAASQTFPIDDKCTNDDKFDRYYFIMKTIRKNHEEFPHVFNDAYNLFKEGLIKDIYNNVMLEIINYATNETEFFPELINE